MESSVKALFAAEGMPVPPISVGADGSLEIGDPPKGRGLIEAYLYSRGDGAMSEGDIKIILDRIDRLEMKTRLLSMDERLSQGIASLAKGQKATVILVNEIHDHMIRLEKGSTLEA